MNCNSQFAHFNGKEVSTNVWCKILLGMVKRKGKIFQRVDDDVFSTFRIQLAFKCWGRRRKRKRTDNSKSWYNIKTFAPLKGTKSYTLVCVIETTITCDTRWCLALSDGRRFNTKVLNKNTQLFALVIFSNLCGIQV